MANSKRRASDEGVEDEYEDGATPSSSKRPRVEDDDEEKEDEETIEQKEFEAKFGEKIRASIEAKSHYQGRVAECGIIQSLEMQQFMCHPRLSFVFGPQINFIIGQNGSGKSAVLSALTVALGGKATTTGRGSGLKAFIQEGKTWAEVTVTIKNEGDEPFKPEVYGKSIIITRQFTKAGSSSYKIKNKEGKTVSTKKEELSAICDHMNIQVDNPMNILSQDSARQFLSNSHPTDKYEFFLKGTQLKQLSEEYEACLENITKTFKILEAKKEVLPDLSRAVKDAESRYEGAQAALETRGRVKQLKAEAAWAYVAEKEDEMKSKIEDVAKRTRKVPKIQKDLDDAKAEHARFTESILAIENQIEELGDIDALTARKAELAETMRANKSKIRAYKENEKNMTVDLGTANGSIESLRERIATETMKLQEDKKAEQEERKRKLDGAKRDKNEHEARLREVNDRIRQLTGDLTPLKNKIATAETVATSAKAEMQQCGNFLRQLNQQAMGRADIYGNHMAQVRQHINTAKWNGEVPVGPLGLFVSLRDSKWAELMQTTLGNLMTSFAVTDARDRANLKDILTKSGNGHCQIVVSEIDNFDYSSGEPHADMLTVLRALKFTDHYVKRIFINQNRIERTLLAETRAEGERVGRESRGGGTAWTADMYRVIAYPEGGIYSLPMQEIKIHDRRKRFFADEDPEKEKLIWRERGQKADQAYQRAQADIASTRAELNELDAKLSACNSEAQELNEKLLKLKQALRSLQEQRIEDIPVNIASLEEAMKEAEEEKENILKQFKDLFEAKSEVEREQAPLLEESNKIKHQIEEFEAKQQSKKNDLVDAAGKRSAAQEKINRYEIKLENELKLVEELEKAAGVVQGEYENWTREAEVVSHGHKIDNPRKRSEVERELNSVQKALAHQEKENGATLEELEEVLEEAHVRLRNTKQDLRNLSNLNKVLKQSITRRIARWHDFRRHIALRTKFQFQHHLSMRGYFGKVLFDHERQKLELKVQTDDQAATQGLNKDPRSLSGGEKSFATICLLLALWEAIGCPIRCLDEFDVFMDAVNRRISMRMMIDTANASDSKQFILITPQDMSSVTFGPTVRVHRMGNPERGQSTL